MLAFLQCCIELFLAVDLAAHFEYTDVTAPAWNTAAGYASDWGLALAFALAVTRVCRV